MNRKKHTIDVAGLAPGRVATKIAGLLMGKHKVSYTPNVDNGDKVTVLNADKIVFTGKKMEQKEYRHHTMHPGGLKEKPAKILFVENPEEVIRHAVAKMIPKNKHRSNRMRRLTFGKV